MRNVIIVARGSQVARLSVSGSTAKIKDFEGVVPDSVGASTRINALACVNHTLRQLSESESFFDEKEPTVIYTIGLVVDLVNNGSSKYWVLGNGVKKSTGETVHAEELEQWKAFFELYSNMYEHIILKDVASLKIRTGSRIPITNEQRVLSGFAEKAWDKIKVVAPTLIEDASDDAI